MAHGALFMLDALVTFQDGADLEQHIDDTDNLFSRFFALENAQAAHEHTEQPTTQLGSVSFVDAISTIE